MCCVSSSTGTVSGWFVGGGSGVFMFEEEPSDRIDCPVSRQKSYSCFLLQLMLGTGISLRVEIQTHFYVVIVTPFQCEFCFAVSES